MQELLLCLMGRRHVLLQTRRASETTHRLSAKPGYVEEWRRPPRLRGQPLRACPRRTPRRIPLPTHPIALGRVVAFDVLRHSRHPERNLGFEAAFLRPARSHAYASPTPSLGPAQGLLPARAGSPLAGRDSHPLDNRQSFMKASHPPIPIDPHCLVAP